MNKPHGNKGRFAPFLFFIALCFLMLFGLIQTPNMQNYLATTNRELPAFDLPVSGSFDTRFTPATFKGQVSLIHFFATWCGICMREQPHMIKLSEEAKVPLYTVIWRSDPNSIPKWQENTGGFKFAAIDATGEAGMQFGIMGVPHTFLVDKKGRIRYSYIGALSDEEINERLIPLIQKYQNEQ